MNKHTKGPWFTEVCGEQIDVWTRDGVVATLNNAKKVKTKANACLIVAAPELLIAAELADTLCKLIARWVDAECDDAFRIMDDIVALAEFESQPEKAILKARGAITPSLAQGA
ncbi:MAG: hypothetical protein ABL901_03845 [Hyphomicrobiaceae bacterium]